MVKIIKIINKNNLSWKAKGIYTFIHDNYKHMDITVEFLSKISTDSISSITSGIRELLDLKLIKENKSVEFIAQLMEKRKEKYEDAADVVIRTDGKTILQICEELITRLMELEEK